MCLKDLPAGDHGEEKKSRSFVDLLFASFVRMLSLKSTRVSYVANYDSISNQCAVYRCSILS